MDTSWNTRLLFKAKSRASFCSQDLVGVQKKIDLEDKLKPDPESVQGILEIALKRFQPINCPSVFISSRTDKGVHGLENAAHVDFEHPQGDSPSWPEFMIHGLNRYFCKAHADLRIKNILPVPDTFHSRFNAKSRTYLYRIAVQKSSWSQDFSHEYNIKIPMGEWKRCCMIGDPNFDIDKVKEAASYFVGLKDFLTFTGRGNKLPEGYSTVRRINSLTISPGQPLINSIYDPTNHMYDFWDVVVNAKSFNYRQVRRMVAVLIAVAQNKIEVTEVKNMIEDPSNYGWNPKACTAPPYGLYLLKVEYDPKDLIFSSQSADNINLDMEGNSEIWQ
ncbi:tRNA pseudouridine synthase-like 1 isoform X2 [Ischnura elegans]|uniref:tRNA pseudouridine synthase-like 1 isoform X2 n=1 Tax=Ischnura elegans TaxID=197161 RepID=UPI001ED8786C|nr:tRNA pseudouridine synthase-like 1 isoform X2 [Ischnura elegans]